jgi:hypothetical protein
VLCVPILTVMQRYENLIRVCGVVFLCSEIEALIIKAKSRAILLCDCTVVTRQSVEGSGVENWVLFAGKEEELGMAENGDRIYRPFRPT